MKTELFENIHDSSKYRKSLPQYAYSKPLHLFTFNDEQIIEFFLQPVPADESEALKVCDEVKCLQQLFMIRQKSLLILKDGAHSASKQVKIRLQTLRNILCFWISFIREVKFKIDGQPWAKVWLVQVCHQMLL